MTIVLISDGELEQYSCQQLGSQLRDLGRRCLTVGPVLTDPQPLPLSRQDLQITSALQLLGHAVLGEASAIGLFLHDPLERQKFIDGYRTLCQHNHWDPAPIFSGPFVPLMGDALIQDLCQRLNCDLLMLSGPEQLEQLQMMSFNWPITLQPPPAVSTGFWFPCAPPKAEPANTPLLLALIQETIPTRLGAREQLIRQLQRWASLHPDWTIVLQPDHGWTAEQPLLGLAAKTTPINLVEAAPGQMLNLLSRCTACLSVSSPWSLAAMAWDAKTLMVGDYGIQADQNTVGWFGCGAMHRVREIRNLNELHELPSVNRAWFEGIGGAIHDGPERLLQALEDLPATTGQR